MFDFLLFVAIMKLKGGVGNEQQLYSEGFKYTASKGVLFSILILAIFLSAVVGLLSPFIYSYLANYVTLGSKDKELVSLKSLFKTSSFGFRPPYKRQKYPKLSCVSQF